LFLSAGRSPVACHTLAAAGEVRPGAYLSILAQRCQAVCAWPWYYFIPVSVLVDHYIV